MGFPHPLGNPGGQHSVFLLTIALLLAAVHAQGHTRQTDRKLVTLRGTQQQPQEWTLPGTSSFPFFNATGSSVLALDYVVITDNTEFNGPLVFNQPFPDLLLLPWLGVVAPSASASLQHVTVKTSCQTLRAIQQAACRSLSLDQLGMLRVIPGHLHVPSWTGSQVTVTDLSFVCDEPVATSINSLSVSVPDAIMECAVAHALDWEDMVHFTAQLQLSADVVHILLDTNVTMPANYTAASRGAMEIYRKVRISPLPMLEECAVCLVLDYTAGEGLWHIADDNATLTFVNIMFAALPLGPPGKYPVSVLPWAFWAVRMNRCEPRLGALVLIRCVMITPTETMAYTSYWAGEYLSVFPDRALAARWYGQDTSCTPVQNRTLLNRQTHFLNQGTWVADNATAFGVQYFNTTITSRLPPGSVPTQPGLQLTKLFEDPYTPFPQITWVSSPEDLIDALVTQPTTNIVILTNLTIPPRLWPKESIHLRRNMVITGWPSRTTVLDWEGVSGVISLGTYTLKIRNLELMNGGQGAAGTKPAWAANLTLYQWPIAYDWKRLNSLQLQSVILVVPPSEFAILVDHHSQQASGNSALPTSTRANGGLSWLQTAAFTSNSCRVEMLVEEGLLGYNVTLTTQGDVYPLMPLDVVISPGGLRNQSNNDVPDHNWHRVLLVVLPVIAGSVVLLAGVACFMWQRRKRQPQGLFGVKDDAADKSTGRPTPAASVDTEAGPCDGAGVVVGAHMPTDYHSQENRALDGDSKLTSSQVGGASSAHDSMIDLFAKSLNRHMQGPGSRLLDACSAQSVCSMPNGSAGSQAVSITLQDMTHGLQSVSATTPWSQQQHHMSQQQLHSLHNQSPQAQQPRSAPVYRQWQHQQQSVSSLQGNGSQAGQMEPKSQGALHAVLSGLQFSQSASDAFTDSFDMAPQDQGLLLINRFDLSPDLQAAAAMPDVAAQLKSLVARMQHELGDQEVSITRVIGHGGSGVVYQGQWRGLTVAVKSLVFTVLPSQPMSRRQHRAMTEAAICRNLQHPNIVATYSYDLQMLQSTRAGGIMGSPDHSSASNSMSSSGAHSRGMEPPLAECLSTAAEYKLYIIQEFCDGGTLKSIVDDGVLHMTTAGGNSEPLMASILQLALDIAAGMAHVHSRNIVHGDLTPANVLLKINDMAESHFSAKVADFGLSWKLSNGQEHVSNARQGTGFYISPEVLHVGIMSKPADVFSFGMLLHEMYHGTPVWRRGHTNLAQAAEAASKRPGLDQLSWSPACPPALRALISACLSADAQSRPTFKSIVNKLTAMQEKVLSGQRIGATPATSVENVAATVAGADELLPTPVAEQSEPAVHRQSTTAMLEAAALTSARSVRQAVRAEKMRTAKSLHGGHGSLMAAIRVLQGPMPLITPVGPLRKQGSTLPAGNGVGTALDGPVPELTLWPPASTLPPSTQTPSLEPLAHYAQHSCPLPFAWQLTQFPGNMASDSLANGTPRWSVGLTSDASQPHLPGARRSDGSSTTSNAEEARSSWGNAAQAGLMQIGTSSPERPQQDQQTEQEGEMLSASSNEVVLQPAAAAAAQWTAKRLTYDGSSQRSTASTEGLDPSPPQKALPVCCESTPSEQDTETLRRSSLSNARPSCADIHQNGSCMLQSGRHGATDGSVQPTSQTPE